MVKRILKTVRGCQMNDLALAPEGAITSGRSELDRREIGRFQMVREVLDESPYLWQLLMVASQEFVEQSELIH